MAISCLAAPTTITWRGLTIGMTGNPSLTAGSQIDGLDLPDVDTADLPVLLGAQPGRIRWPARDLTVTEVITLDTATTEALRAVMITGDADASAEALDVECPTMWTGTRRLWARPRRAQSSAARGSLVTRALLRNLQWAALDPRWYATAENEHTLPGTIGHAGNVQAPWRAVLAGPVAGPELRRTDTADAIRWPTVTLGAGDTLAINTRTMTATINGASDVWGLSVDDAGDPPIGWDLPPGVGIPITTNAPSGSVWVAATWL